MEALELRVGPDALVTTVYRGGAGPDLLFLHGELGLSEVEQAFLDRLAESFHVVAPVHPAFHIHEAAQHLEEAQDLAVFSFDVLDALGLEQVALLGHSLGAMVAAEMMTLCPHRGRRLALVSPLGLWADEAPIPDFFVLPREELRGLSFADSEGAVARAVLPDHFPDQDAEMAYWQTLAATGKLIWGLPYNPRLARRLYRISVPTLVVAGEADRVTPPIYAALYAQGVRQAKQLLLRDVGHYPHLEAPGALLSQLEPFLRG